MVKNVFSTWGILSTVSSDQGTQFTGQNIQALKKSHKLVEIITVTIILNHQARSTKLMKKWTQNKN